MNIMGSTGCLWSFSIPILLHVLLSRSLATQDYDGEKRLGTSEDTRDPPPTKEGELSTQPEDVEEGEVEEMVELVTTTGDVHVVEEQSTHFTTDSAQRLIQDIMWCSRDLDLIKEKTKEIEQRMKNMIDVLGRI
ncbi:proteinase-activated receptor 4 isoform X3 [Aquarana catesbeiana]|uniref:proteinase-activated receptor 4 isoform X3 n=1 Tax=Aquarana catesbeiana TaxID=8400 RepID=UPI003CC9A13B